jgi:alpha/beta hydrolase family protein
MSVTALDVHTRVPVLDGRPFGAAGAYEKVVGTLRFAIDPAHAVHARVCDLDRAPRDAAGRVAFAGDFYLLRPADPARGNGSLLLDVPNRGRKVALGMLNSAVRVPDPSRPEDYGNGFLMRHSWTVAWIGWQADVPRVDGLMALDVPRARGASGLVRCEFRPNAPVDVLPLADRYHVPHPAAEQDDPAARLTVREHVGAPATAVPRTAWRFARRRDGRLVADTSHVHLEGGFQPGRIYDLVYPAVDSPVIGLGLLAVRDTAAFLRWGTAAEGNPCAGMVQRAYAFGVSQTGRLLRHLLYLGLDEDEQGRTVFDAVVPHVAGARRGEFNLRFGQPSLNAQESVGGLFPFADEPQTDSVTGQRDGLLARVTARGRRPRVVSVNTSAEYWRGDASLVHTDVEGRRDVEPPDDVRVYAFAGAQHTPGSLPPPTADPNTGGRGTHPFNVVDYAPLLRAVLANLDAWVRDGVAPPPSVFPRLADGTAVTAESTAARFAAIPGVRFPERLARPSRLDFGPGAAQGVVSELPPKIGAAYPGYVAAVDVDGNETAGIRPIELQAPLATFTGWNPRHPEQGAPGDLMAMMGSTLVFARTRQERQARRDPRPSIEERYATRADYLAAARAAAEALVEARHALAEDVEAMVERAGQRWDLIMRGL